MIQGEKKFIGNDSVRYLSLPQYEGLGIKEVLQQALGYEVCTNYLPEQEEFRKLPRQWLINLCYTLIGQPFADWAKAIIESRNQRLVEEQKLAIDIDPQILHYFNQSTAVSSKSTVNKLLTQHSDSFSVYNHSSEGQRRLLAQGWLQAQKEVG